MKHPLLTQLLSSICRTSKTICHNDGAVARLPIAANVWAFEVTMDRVTRSCLKLPQGCSRNGDIFLLEPVF